MGGGDEMKKITEALIQAAILEYLAARKIYAARLNSGQILGSSNGRKWAIKLAPKGTADILALPITIVHGICPLGYTQAVFIEVKDATGKQSPAQIEFQKYVEGLGHRYLLARSVVDVEAAL